MALAFALAAYLCLWPVPIEAVKWEAPRAPGYSASHAVNHKLDAGHTISLHGEVGPEHVVIGPDNKIYVGVASGRILRISPDDGTQEVFAVTGGRGLGMAFDGNGDLIVADAFKGLLSIAPNGMLTILIGTGRDEAISFPNALVIARNGKIFFTDSSARFTPSTWGTTQAAALLDLFEQSATGRVLEYDRDTKQIRVIAKGLSLANGIALSSDERSLFVSESGRYRVWKIDINANEADIATRPPGVQVFLDNLPGYPDNLMRGEGGRIWVGLAGQRNELDSMAGRPFMRELALRIPRSLWPDPKPYGHVFAFTEDGKVVDDLQDPGGHSASTTGATETSHRFYIHNVDHPELSWIEKPDNRAAMRTQAPLPEESRRSSY
jgi:sugar lactone lactonase YvrE